MRFLTWREPKTLYNLLNILEGYAFGRGSVCVRYGISLDDRTAFHVFLRGTVNAQVYRDDIHDAFVCLLAGAIDDAFLLQDDNARPYSARIVDDYLQQETNMLMEWPGRYPDLNPIEHVWDTLGKRLVVLNLPPQFFAAVATALKKQWL